MRLSNELRRRIERTVILSREALAGQMRRPIDARVYVASLRKIVDLIEGELDEGDRIYREEVDAEIEAEEALRDEGIPSPEEEERELIEDCQGDRDDW